MNSLEVVREHFDRDAERFDAIYERNKPLLHRLMDPFRNVVVHRFRLVCTLAPVPGRWSVLDVGCGPGRYGVALAKLGASRIVDLDISSAMLELAATRAAKEESSAEFEFVNTDFLGFETDERFDVVLAMGYFDYLEDAVPHLSKMREASRGRIFASIPKRWEWRVPIRKLRYLFARWFVRFYSRREAEALIEDAGFEPDRVSLVDLGRDWLLVANCS